jgi:hypothetical protein
MSDTTLRAVHAAAAPRDSVHAAAPHVRGTRDRRDVVIGAAALAARVAARLVARRAVALRCRVAVVLQLTR